ncbi:MAG: hypothetical protein ACE5Q6_13535 [Dehalococcoidia bacterium]
MATEETTGGGLAYTLMRFLIGKDLERARKRMRYAWIAGFVAAGINFAVALMTFPVEEAGGVDPIGGVAFALVMLEAALLAVLAYGVRKQKRAAAVALLLYFILSKIISYSVGIGSLTALPLQLIFAYLFFQGMRGALTFYYLTHPEYPTAAPAPEAAIAGSDAATPEEGE